MAKWRESGLYTANDSIALMAARERMADLTNTISAEEPRLRLAAARDVMALRRMGRAGRRLRTPADRIVARTKQRKSLIVRMGGDGLWSLKIVELEDLWTWSLFCAAARSSAVPSGQKAGEEGAADLVRVGLDTGKKGHDGALPAPSRQRRASWRPASFSAAYSRNRE